MTHEQRFLIQVLSDHLNQTETQRCENLDWKQLYTYAKQQQLQGIVFSQCMEIIDDPEVFQKLEQAYYSQFSVSLNRCAMVEELKAALNDAEIPFSVVKGHLVMELYPCPEMRSMGDTDVMIHNADRERVHRVMSEAGFECTSAEGDEWNYRKHGLSVEMHDSLVHLHRGNERIVAYFNEHIWESGTYDGSCLIPDWNFHFMYLIQHISGHFLITGIGIRQFMDLVVVVRNEQLDWAFIRQELTRLGLWGFCEQCLAFCRKAFGLSVPGISSEMEEGLYEESLAKMFSDGVFGHEDAANRAMSEMMITRFYEKRKAPRSALGSAINTLFPEYEYIKRLPYCRFVEGRKYLLPAAWAWRIVFKCGTGAVRKKPKPIPPEEWEENSTRNRVNMYSRWGL